MEDLSDSTMAHSLANCLVSYLFPVSSNACSSGRVASLILSVSGIYICLNVDGGRQADGYIASERQSVKRADVVVTVSGMVQRL